MRNIIIDLDGVIYNFVESFWHELEWYYPEYSSTNMEYFFLHEKELMSDAMMNNLLRCPNIYERMKCTPENKDALQKLSEKYVIWYVTSRPKEAELATKHWLKREKLPHYDHLILTSNKGEIADSLDIEFAVDDMPKYVDQMKQHKVYLMDAFYNQNFNYTVRIKSLMELV